MARADFDTDGYLGRDDLRQTVEALVGSNSGSVDVVAHPSPLPSTPLNGGVKFISACLKSSPARAPQVRGNDLAATAKKKKLTTTLLIVPYGRGSNLTHQQVVQVVDQILQEADLVAMPRASFMVVLFMVVLFMILLFLIVLFMIMLFTVVLFMVVLFMVVLFVIE